MRKSTLGTLNNSEYSGQIVGMDSVGFIGQEYLSVKIDYMSRLVQVNVCSEANSRSVLQGVMEWERTYGRMDGLVTDRGTHFNNSLLDA